MTAAEKEFNKAFEDDEMTEEELMEKEFGRKPKKGYHFVRSIMGPVVELKDGTPRCCDPSTELYWSM